MTRTLIKASLAGLSLLWGAEASAEIGRWPQLTHTPNVGSATLSANWAGYANEILVPPGPELEAVFVVPQYSARDANLDGVSIWTGFDGLVDHDHLLAAGVDCFANGATGERACFTWIEYYPDATIALAYVNPGDTIGLFSFHNTDGTGGGAYVYNYTSGEILGQQSFTCDAPQCPSRDPYTGTSAEWIVGAPTINGQIVPLANFSPVEIYNCIMLSFNGARDRYPGDETTSHAITLGQNGLMLVPTQVDPFSFQMTPQPNLIELRPN